MYAWFCLVTFSHPSKMVLSLLLLITFMFLGLALYTRKVTRWKNSPPGPEVHPLLGSFPALAQLDPVPFKAWHTLSLHFGPLVRLVMGFTNMLVICGYKEMKEAMNVEALDDRALSPTGNLIMFGSDTSSCISFFARAKMPRGCKVSPMEKWRELRRFVLKSLRDLGFGKTASEEAIVEESKVLIKNIAEQIEETNGILDLEKSLNCASLNVIWNLVAGLRFAHDDPSMKSLVEISGDFMLIMGKDVIGKPFQVMPFLRFLPPFKQKFDKLFLAQIRFREFMNKAIEEHKRTFDEEDHRDLIDMFLAKMKDDQLEIYTQPQLVQICIDLFIAGSETTSKSLLFAIALMIRYPRVQEKIHEELDKIDGPFVSMKDRPKLPYVEATLSEVWRFCNIAPFGPPRLAHKDTHLKSTTVPAGSIIMYNTFSLHMDKDHWGDPEVFRPERFLDDAGKFRPDEYSLPFGIGRRRCLGESLARMENFLFFTNLFKAFQFLQVGNAPPSLEPDFGITNGPYPFSTKVVSRRK